MDFVHHALPQPVRLAFKLAVPSIGLVVILETASEPLPAKNPESPDSNPGSLIRLLATGVSVGAAKARTAETSSTVKFAGEPLCSVNRTFIVSTDLFGSVVRVEVIVCTAPTVLEAAVHFSTIVVVPE